MAMNEETARSDGEENGDTDPTQPTAPGRKLKMTRLQPHPTVRYCYINTVKISADVASPLDSRARDRTGAIL